MEKTNSKYHLKKKEKKKHKLISPENSSSQYSEVVQEVDNLAWETVTQWNLENSFYLQQKGDGNKLLGVNWCKSDMTYRKCRS